MKLDKESIFGIIMGFVFIIPGILLFKYGFIPLTKQYFDAKKCKSFSTGHTFKAGGRFDLWNYNFPFVNIKLEDIFIEIKTDSNIIINYDQIVTVERYVGFISNGVYIKHNKNDIPEKIIIWTPYYNQLIDYINSKISIKI